MVWALPGLNHFQAIINQSESSPASFKRVVGIDSHLKSAFCPCSSAILAAGFQ